MRLGASRAKNDTRQYVMLDVNTIAARTGRMPKQSDRRRLSVLCVGKVRGSATHGLPTILSQATRHPHYVQPTARAIQGVEREPLTCNTEALFPGSLENRTPEPSLSYTLRDPLPSRFWFDQVRSYPDRSRFPLRRVALPLRRTWSEVSEYA
jgi:hypothetical protein